MGPLARRQQPRPRCGHVLGVGTSSVWARLRCGHNVWPRSAGSLDRRVGRCWQSCQLLAPSCLCWCLKARSAVASVFCVGADSVHGSEPTYPSMLVAPYCGCQPFVPSCSGCQLLCATLRPSICLPRHPVAARRSVEPPYTHQSGCHAVLWLSASCGAVGWGMRPFFGTL